MKQKETFPELPLWVFEAIEVSAGAYQVTGRDVEGRSVSAVGYNPDELLDQLKADAKRLDGQYPTKHLPGRPRQFEGQEAVDFAEQHLRKLKANPQTWEVEYDDPKTGEKWVMDYPHSELQGGGSPRLRKVDFPVTND